MAIDQRKHEHTQASILRDIRPIWQRIADTLGQSVFAITIFLVTAVSFFVEPWALAFADVIMVLMAAYFTWLIYRDKSIAFKLPMSAKFKDAHNTGPGKNGKPEGILYLGNTEEGKEEVWFTNSDARTHILYLGTTGSGKTEGLKSMVSNAMSWGSGFVYVDGKADTDLWSSLSSLVRRFGRDDDLLVLNYMTGNADVQAPSNTMNPFSSGSASYLTNMLVELMPPAEGDNAMWKERAVSLVSAMMPALTYKRDNQDMPLSVRTIRDYLSLNNVIKLQRDETVPIHIREGLRGYLDTLPGFVHEAYDNEGSVKPPGPDTPQYDTTTASQQHGYLAMQFTRALQSLGDDYGYIFDTQAADVDMLDVVLNRRILVVLIPALEKSGDEIANLGKIVAATMKGMMGSTLGATVEGESAKVIENKPTHSATPFMTVFDEVGYYTASGMAVMAAQARSLGFSLVFSGQDLPAMKKRVREEANSITANCNIKVFGKLEDPTETKEFFEKTVGSAYVTEVSGFQATNLTNSYFDSKQAGIQTRARATYDELRTYKEGQAIITFGDRVSECRIFYSNPGHAKAMRVTRFIALPQPDEEVMKHADAITVLRDRLVDGSWTAKRADVDVETPVEIEALLTGFATGRAATDNLVDAGIAAVIEVQALKGPIEAAASAPPSASKPAAKTAEKAPQKDGEKPQGKPQEKTPPKAEQPSGDKKAPMSFFSKDDTPTAKTEKPEAKTPDDKTSQQVEQLKNIAQKHEAKDDANDAGAGASDDTVYIKDTDNTPPQSRSAGTPAKLPPSIEKIIGDAAQKARKAIFKDGEDA